MISNDEIKNQLMGDEVNFVEVTGDGYHYHATVVSDVFIGKSRVQRQQWVYSKLNNMITSGELHALNMTTCTLEEWEKKNG